MATDENARAVMRKLIGKAWADPEFKDQLVNDPKRHLSEAGLLEAGVAANPNVNVKIVEDTAEIADTHDTLCFFLPPRPALGAELTDDQLQRATEVAVGMPRPTGIRTCCCDITVAPSVFD